MSQFIFDSSIWRLYPLFFFSRWQWLTIIWALAAIRNSLSTFSFTFSISILSCLIIFIGRLIFLHLVDFPSVLKLLMHNFHFSRAPKHVSRFIINNHFKLSQRSNYVLFKISHSQKVLVPAYKWSMISMCL